jgi:hypothetical protein
MLVRPRSLALAILATGLALHSAARASDVCSAAPLVSTCINSDNLWPHAGPSRFVGVGGTELLDPGRIGFGIVADYLSRPIVFQVPSPGGSGSSQYAIDNQVNGTFLWAYGVTRRLELDLGVPITFGQTGTGAEPITGSSQHLQQTAVRDMRFGAAYALVPREPSDHVRAWALTARFEVSAPTGDRTQFAGDRTGVFIPSVAADYRRGRWFAGIEVGARIRPAEQLLGANVGTQGVVGLGIGYDVLKRLDLLSVMVEARALPTFATQYVATPTPTGTTEASNSTFLAPAEWMVSLRTAPLGGGAFSVTAGGGGALPFASAEVTEPRLRFVLGIRYAPSEADRDRDRDGIPDTHDRCPDDPGPAPTGCPEGMTPMPHLDLVRASDKCKGEPDMVDGFKTDDGCPDEDTDKDGIPDRYDLCPLVPDDLAGLPDGCPEGQAPTPAPKKP